ATRSDEAADGFLKYGDPSVGQLAPALGVALELPALGDDGDTPRPVQQPEREAGDVLVPSDNRHPAFACLVPVARRAVEDVGAVVVEEPGDVRELVLDAGGEHEAS